MVFVLLLGDKIIHSGGEAGFVPGALLCGKPAAKVMNTTTMLIVTCL